MTEYTALIRNENGIGELKTENYNSMASFSKELRNRGYKVVRVERKDIYDYCMGHTNCDENDFEMAKICLKKEGKIDDSSNIAKYQKDVWKKHDERFARLEKKYADHC